MNCPTILIPRIIMQAWLARAPSSYLETANSVHSTPDATDD